MGLLDDLKKQAESLKTQQVSQEAKQTETLRVVDEKMKQLFQYLNELLKQLTVVKPTHPATFEIPGIGEMKGLKFTESFIDYRRKKMFDREYYDSINFYMKWTSDAKLIVERDMPATVQKTRDALWAVAVKFTEEEIKSDRGLFAKARFTIPSVVVADVQILSDYDKGQVVFRTTNMLRLGKDDYAVPAAAVDSALLEEFAKMMMGSQSEFRKYKAVVALKR